MFLEMIKRWRHPNGLIWAMSAGNYGHAGAWTESLGVIAPFQEMLLQSWDGALRVFPCWPQEIDARFDGLRAEGAFLVSAAWTKGNVEAFDILSEKGATCRVHVPWPNGMIVRDASGAEAVVQQEQDGVVTFPTTPGARYSLQPRG